MADDEKIKKILEHRRYVLREFVESEREYVGRLHTLYEDYYSYIKQSSSPDVPATLKSDLLSIFSSLPEIFTFHRDVFLPEMERTDWEDEGNELMDCFLRHNTDFSAYVSYCKNKPTSDHARVEYEAFFSKRQSELGQKLSIEDLLITPVQRLPKYQLLIRDLLKDTKKIHMDTAKIDEALELMKKIPKEANDIICMSLIKGVSRANIISHGTLWIQDTLLFSVVDNGNGGTKEESKHVFLFDHLILITNTGDSDGFYEYLMGIKTLNGRVSSSDDDPLKFVYTRENGGVYTFKASTSQAREEWVNDIKSIHTTQDQMKKALIFGKPSSMDSLRSHSVTLNWSDSDSSIDSLPSSCSENSDNEGDWPEQTGFHRIKHSPSASLNIVVTKEKSKNQCKLKQVKSVMETRRMTTPEDAMKLFHPSNLARPHSFHASTVAEFDQTMQKKTVNTLAISPRVLKRWVPRKAGRSKNTVHIYFPRSSQEYNPMRSPGAQARVERNTSQPPPDDLFYVAVEHQPPVADQLYKAPPGQVFLPEDTSKVDVWKVVAVSGENAGESVWMQRNTLEEYSASVLAMSLKKSFSVVNFLSSGRFSDVKLVRQKQTKKLQALKVFKESSYSEEQFYRELCIGSRINHHNLITYHKGLHHNRLNAISMDYINGRSLLDYLVRKSSVSEKMIADFMLQLFDALSYLHSHTILHLDVRPGNILIHLTRESDVLKLIDYGAARHSGGSMDTLNLHFESSYKYEYVPPEVFQQVPVGPGTDMWSVGVIMYLIFHGISPFVGGSTVRTIANITAVQYYFPTPRHPACSEQAKNLMKDIFTAFPENRPAASAAMKYPWFTERALFMNNKIDLLQLQQYIRHYT